MKNSEKLKPFSVTIFVVSFILIFISISSQYFFSQKRVNNYLQKITPETAQSLLEFRKAQVSFSGSLFPFFAIKITDINLKYEDCRAGYAFKAPYILIPISIRDVFKDKIKLGYLKFGSAKLSIKDPVLKCLETQNQVKTFSLLELESTKYEDLFKNTQRIFKSVNGIRAKKLEFNELRKDKVRTIIFKNLRLSHHKKNKSIHSYFEIPIPSTKSKNIIKAFSQNSDKNQNLKQNLKFKVSTELNQTTGLSFKASARYLEGVFELESKPQKALNSLEVKFKIKDLPLTFASFLIGPKPLEEVSSHRVWFNSSFKVFIRNFLNSEPDIITTKVESLEIFGPVLKSYASGFKLQLYPKLKLLKPINWRLDSLNLNGFLSQKNLKPLRGVVDQFGSLRGAGRVNIDQSISFEGLISKSSFSFSMNRKKSQQIVSKANININYAHPEVGLEIEDIILEKGVFDGQIFGDINWKDKLTWVFGANAKLFSLSKNVQELFAIKQTPFENLAFKMKGVERELESLNFKAQLPMLKTKWGAFKNSNYKLNYNPEAQNYKFDLDSKQFSINTEYIELNSLSKYENLNGLSTSLILSAKAKSFDLIAKTSAVPKVLISAKSDDYNKNFLATLNLENTNYVVEGHINSGFEIKKKE